MAKRECAECGKVFEYQPPENFPDKRKYCDECSAKKKAEWEARKGEKTSSGGSETQKSIVQAAKHDIVISKVEKPHSYEFGKAGARHKIYYGDIAELKEHIRILKAENLVDEDLEF